MERFAAFDLETTSIDPTIARPVEVGVVPDDEGDALCLRCHPGTFPADYEDAAAVHGITRESLIGCPPWEEAVEKARRALGDLPILVYNGIAYDLRITPRIAEGRTVVDVFRLAQLLQVEQPIPDVGTFGHPLGLAALSLRLEVLYGAVTGRPLALAHNAAADAEATIVVFRGLVERYHALQSKSLAEIAADLESPPGKWSDWSRTCEYKHGHWRLNIGKHKGQRLNKTPRSYLQWMLSADFAESTKDLVRTFL